MMKRTTMPPAAPTATYSTKSMPSAGSKWVAVVFNKRSVTAELLVSIESVWVVVSDRIVVNALKFMFCSVSFKLLSDPLTVELNLAESVDDQD